MDRSPGQEPLHCYIREVVPPSAASIEMQFEAAKLSFEWRSEILAQGRTKLTQRVILSGENAATYLSQVESTFKTNLPAGMSKLAAAITNAFSNRERPGQ